MGLSGEQDTQLLHGEISHTNLLVCGQSPENQPIWVIILVLMDNWSHTYRRNKFLPKGHPLSIKMGLFLLLTILFVTTMSVSIKASEHPERQTEIIIPYSQFEWWLIRWSTNQPECQIITDHEGLPTGDDVFVYCGEDLHAEWLETESCPAAISKKGNTANCKGLYVHLISETPAEKTVQIELPTSEAWINMTECTPVPPDNRCETLPNLIFIGEEPLPNEHITQIQGTFNSIPFVCPPGDNCEIPLRPTPLQGVTVEFWADSSYGDSSEHYSALVRVIDSGVASGADISGWYVDVISERWLGEQLSSCSQAWNTFPPIGGELPHWLSTPETPDMMASEKPYSYLAGRLIVNNVVDASSCPGNGLEQNGYANTCGLEVARPEVILWQNQFDDEIFSAANQINIPAQLIKNLFAQESQFWPGEFQTAEEYGFGQLTDKGADTVLLWNDDFYTQFCPLILAEDTCSLGYTQIGKENQNLLRGALAIESNADCIDCPTGIDLTHADFTIQVFAQTIKANCVQTGQIISNHTGQPPGAVSKYEDLWRYTLINYHAGPGCLSDAVKEVKKFNQPVNWNNVSNKLVPICPGAVEYVEKVAIEQ